MQGEGIGEVKALRGLTVRDEKGVLCRADFLGQLKLLKVLSPEMKEKIKFLSSPSQVDVEDFKKLKHVKPF